MRRILLVLCFMLSCNLFLSSQSIHVLQRGETLESVARKYGITPDEIKNANPKLVRVYAGMKLNIPKSTDQLPEQIDTPDNSTSFNNSTNVYSNKESLAQMPNENEELTDDLQSDTYQAKEKNKSVSKRKHKKELTEAELLAKAEKKQRRKEKWGKIKNFLGKAGTVLATAGVAALTYESTETSQSGFLGTMEKVNNALTNASSTLKTGGVQGFLEGVERASASAGRYDQIPMSDDDLADNENGDMISIDDQINKLTSEYNNLKRQVDAYDNDNQRRKANAKTSYTRIGGKLVKVSHPEPSKRSKKIGPDNMVIDQASKNAALTTMSLWKKKIDHFQRMKNQGVKYVSKEEAKRITKSYNDAADANWERHKQTVKERLKSSYRDVLKIN